MKQVLALALALLLLAAPAFAHDADGKWEGMVDTPMGAIPVGFTLKTDGATVSGTSLGPDGAGIPIKNGKVDGNKISFSVDLDFGGMAVTLNYVGTAAPDKIAFVGDFMGMPFDFTVTKAK
jgi:opacity protein-like surface antigen